CLAAVEGKLNTIKSKWDPRPALGVVLAAGGYPGDYNTKDVILGLSSETNQNCKIFHAGTSLENGQVYTNGGRVLCVTALGNSVSDAQKNAYEQLKNIYWHGCYYRHDIGYRAIEREKNS
ncbi:MAG: phosphoribosylamine--glycine ligase, partial [Gilliamella apis]|nr:phosphoribosylamine--glycine ligase [Gilliamella apis]